MSAAIPRSGPPHAFPLPVATAAGRLRPGLWLPLPPDGDDVVYCVRRGDVYLIFYGLVSSWRLSRPCLGLALFLSWPFGPTLASPLSSCPPSSASFLLVGSFASLFVLNSFARLLRLIQFYVLFLVASSSTTVRPSWSVGCLGILLYRAPSCCPTVCPSPSLFRAQVRLVLFVIKNLLGRPLLAKNHANLRRRPLAIGA